MNPLDLTGQLATETIQDRVRHGAAARLAALARCCRPRAWRRAARRLSTLLTADHLDGATTRRAASCC